MKKWAGMATVREQGAFVRPSEELKDILADVCLESTTDPDKAYGMYLITLATGKGKSWAARMMCAKYARLVREHPDAKRRRIFYVAPQKKNLPTREELEEAFLSEMMEKPNERDILILKSLDEMLLDGRFALGDAPKVIQSLAAVKGLKEALASYARAVAISERTPSDAAMTGIVAPCKDAVYQAATEFWEALWPWLRSPKRLEPIRGREGQLSANEQRARVKADPDWQWLGTLYPTIFIDDAKIVVCTSRKFASHVRTFVRRPFRLIDSVLVDNSIVILDEVDAIKEDLLQMYAEQAANTPIDLLEANRRICTASQTKDPNVFMTGQGDDGAGSKQVTAKEMLARIKRVTSATYNSTHLNGTIRTNRDLDDGSFIFYSDSFTSKTRGLVVEYDARLRSSVIREKKKDATEKGAMSLSRFISILRGNLGYIKTYLWPLAGHYKRNRDRALGPDDTFTREDAAWSYLNFLSLDPNQSIHILNGSTSRSRKSLDTGGSVTPTMVGDNTVYAKGFNYTILRNSPRHDMSTSMQYVNLHDTPENTLLRLACRTLVFGLSATADIDSVVGGFAMGYFQDQQPGILRDLPKDREARLAAAFDKADLPFRSVEHRCSTVLNCDSVQEWAEMLGDARAGEEAYDIVRQAPDSFIRCRYSRLAGAFKEFLDGGVTAMLALVMPVPSNEKDRLRPDILLDLFAIVAGVCQEPGAERYVKFIGPSSTWNPEREAELRDGLSGGGRAFVIASYQTLGRGVTSLKFKESDPSRSTVVWDDGTNERDFDGIYLDRPRNLFPKPELMEPEKVLSAIYKVKSLYDNDEIPFTTMQSAVDQFLSCLTGGIVRKPISFQNYPSIMRHATRVVCQACGRITRAGIVSNTVHIVIDPSLADSMDTHALDGRMVNHVFASLVDYLDGPEIPNDKDMIAQREAQRKNTYMRRMIYECVSKACWSNEDIKWWELARASFLAYPTFDPSKDVPSEVHSLLVNSYFKLPNNACAYTCDEDGDYRKVTVSFDENNRKLREVSARAAGMDLLAQVPDAAEAFKLNGWPMVWEPGPYVMPPIAFNNIYLGAIGEGVGRHLLEKYIDGLALDLLFDGEKYEQSDYRVKGTDIYVDFKYRRAGSMETESEALTVIRAKMERLDAEKVLVCNLVAESSQGYRCRILDGGKVMTVPYLIDSDTKSVSLANISAIADWLRR